MVTEPLSADAAISIAWALITSLPDADTAETGLERARTLLNYANVLQQREALDGAREVAALQRKMAGPLEGMAELIDEIADTKDGQWNAGMVNHWIRTARTLVQP